MNPRELYDALDPNNIPAQAQAVAYYTDVLTPAQARARWPGRLLVSIDRVPEQVSGLVDDSERGALAIASLPARAAAKRAAGINPWVYCSLSPQGAVLAAFAAAGVPPPLWWLAVPGPLQLAAGTVATQCVYAGAYDVSALAPYVPGLDQPSQGEIMFFDLTRNKWWTFWVGADGKVYYRTAGSLAELLATPPQPLQEPTGGDPGTKAILGAGVDGAGNVCVSLHGADDTLWYSATADGGTTWETAHDPQATLSPPLTLAQVTAAITLAIAALPVPVTQAVLDTWESSALAGLPTDIAAAVQKAIAALPASTAGASATHTHNVGIILDGVTVPVPTEAPTAGS